MLLLIEERGKGGRDHTYTDWRFVGLLAGQLYLPRCPFMVGKRHYYTYSRDKAPPMPDTIHCPGPNNPQ